MNFTAGADNPAILRRIELQRAFLQLGACVPARLSTEFASVPREIRPSHASIPRKPGAGLQARLFRLGRFGTCAVAFLDTTQARTGEIPYIQHRHLGAVIATRHCGPSLGKALSSASD